MTEVLTRSQKIQATKAAKRASARPSIAHKCAARPLGDDVLISFALDTGAQMSGYKHQINPILEQLGYKPVRITYNMLNKDAGPIVIDADTPSYCDVGSESYWSM